MPMMNGGKGVGKGYEVIDQGIKSNIRRDKMGAKGRREYQWIGRRSINGGKTGEGWGRD